MKLLLQNIILFTKRIFLFVFIVALGLSACKQAKPKASDPLPVSSFSDLVNLSYVIDEDSIRQIISAEFLPLHPVTGFDSAMVSYYSGDELLWFDMPEGIERADSILNWFENAPAYGLSPAVFHVEAIRNDLDVIHDLGKGDGESLNRLLAGLEYRLTRAYLTYVCGMNYGFIKPGKILNNFEEDLSPQAVADTLAGAPKKMKELFAIPLKRCSREFALDAIARLEDDFYAAYKVQPSSSLYQLLQKELSRIRSLGDVAFEEIRTIGDTLLKVGDEHEIVPSIARRLKCTGEVEASYPDSSLVFTQQLLDAVNRFRELNRLAVDPSIGNLTIRYLNRPLSYYEDCLRINMERTRWQYVQERGSKYVVANVAACMLQAVNEEADSVLEMKICCGEVKNKTPLLTSKLSYMELNPYWNVPQNIIMKEMLPAFRKDTTYFTKNRLKIYNREGGQLNPQKIKWSNYTRGVPYTIKQDNKRGNSLGRIIFRFPNTFSVYLHDTPNRWTFMRTNRAVSHGCVRLEKALNFAFFLLPERDELLEDRIRLSMEIPAVTEAGKKLELKDNYKELTFHSLRHRVPLFLDYQTVYISMDGTFSYCDDVYKYDALLLEALDKKTYK